MPSLLDKQGSVATFGLTWPGLTWPRLTWPRLTDAQANTLFTGLGMTILRVGMSSSGGFVNSNEASSIASAKKYGATKIIGSVWSPPALWKDNKKENDGGHLTAEYYGQWAQRIADFAQANGLYAMSVATEPDVASCGSTEPCNGNYPSTLYTANEMVAFVKEVGPRLQAAGIKVIAPETAEWNHLWSNTSACCSEPSGLNSSDPLKCGCFGTSTICNAVCTLGKGYDYGHFLHADSTAWAAFDILGTHQYDSQVATPWPSDVPDKKPVWVTEMAGIRWWPEQGPSAHINNGVAVAGWIHDAIVNGQACAWLWWWYNGSSFNDGLYINGADTKRHYTLSNYSRFVRPGYTRVDVTGNNSTDILLSAYKGSDGTVVIVAINKGSEMVNVPMGISGGAAPPSLTPWVTSADQNLASQTAVPVTGGIFTAALASKSVTTFVGR
jgi:glucuronoarabinoxylan endo-1,4-beta-xylanase